MLKVPNFASILKNVESCLRFKDHIVDRRMSEIAQVGIPQGILVFVNKSSNKKSTAKNKKEKVEF